MPSNTRGGLPIFSRQLRPLLLKWARATSQPPHIVRAARRALTAYAIDPHSWLVAAQLAALYRALNEPAMDFMYTQHAKLLRRRNRVLRAFYGDSPPRKAESMPASLAPSVWSFKGRTFDIWRRGTNTIIIEEPYNPRTFTTTHTRWTGTRGQSLFLRGTPDDFWPQATPYSKPKEPKS